MSDYSQRLRKSVISCQSNTPIAQQLKAIIILAAAKIDELEGILDKPVTEHADVQRLIKQVVELEAKSKAIREQYAKDLVATNKFYFPKPVCKNQPPEITNGHNACLSCPMRKTCLLIFKKRG